MPGSPSITLVLKGSYSHEPAPVAYLTWTLAPLAPSRPVLPLSCFPFAGASAPVFVGRSKTLPRPGTVHLGDHRFDPGAYAECLRCLSDELASLVERNG